MNTSSKLFEGSFKNWSGAKSVSYFLLKTWLHSLAIFQNVYYVPSTVRKSMHLFYMKREILLYDFLRAEIAEIADDEKDKAVL